MAQIKYNGQTIPSPTPFIRKTVENVFYGGRWASRDNIIIEGQITGCNSGALFDGQDDLLEIFSTGFRPLVVSDTGSTVVYEALHTEILSVNFQQSNYVGILPYTIQLACYPEATFSGFFGVLEPEDVWTFKESENQIIEVEHRVSAEGFNTGIVSNALANAIAFVATKTGYANAPTGHCQFITGLSDEIIVSVREEVDRLNGKYAIVETYNVDAAMDGSGIVRYTVDISSGLEGFINVGVQGDVRGGIASDITGVRNRYNEFDFHNIASTYYTGATEHVNNPLNETPLSSGVTESPFQNRLSFNLKFDNNPSGMINLDYTAQISSEEDVATIAINGNLHGRGDLGTRWIKVQEEFDSLNVYDLAVQDYNIYKDGEDVYEVNPIYISSGSSFNKFNGTINFNVSFNDVDQPPEGLDAFDYTIAVTPPVRKIQATPTLASFNYPNNYSVLDMGTYNRARMTINGSATISDVTTIAEGKQIVINEVNKLFLKHGKKKSVIELQNVSYSPEFGRKLGFNFEWSFDGDVVNTENAYDRVLNLKV